MSLTRGVYRIYQWGSSGQPQFLTDLDGTVTIAPAKGTELESSQIWSVEPQEDGGVAIQHPALIFPSRSLSYEGEPEEGKKIILGPLSDFPTRYWSVETAPQKPFPVPYFIRVPKGDLMVVVSPLSIYPPMLVLEAANNDLRNAWAFEPVNTPH